MQLINFSNRECLELHNLLEVFQGSYEFDSSYLHVVRVAKLRCPDSGEKVHGLTLPCGTILLAKQSERLLISTFAHELAHAMQFQQKRLTDEYFISSSYESITRWPYAITPQPHELEAENVERHIFQDYLEAFTDDESNDL
jgi:hypothetical protein